MNIVLCILYKWQQQQQQKKVIAILHQLQQIIEQKRGNWRAFAVISSTYHFKMAR